MTLETVRPPTTADAGARVPSADRARPTGSLQTAQWFEADPLWFKRAVFYEIHIRGFADGNDDGIGDLRGPDGQARLPPVARRRLHLAAADVPLAAAGRRLRHRRLLLDPSRLRHGRGLPRADRGGARARHPRDRRPRHEPHLERPPVVPGGARRPDIAEARLVRLVGHRPPLPRGADHLPRHRGLELDLGSGRRASTTGTASSRTSPT